jgi:hypothetical protein
MTMKRYTRMRNAALAATLGATIAILIPAASRAEPSGPATTESVVVQVMPLKRVGVDKAIADAHGYEVRTTSSGMQYAVKKGSPVTPENTLPGECGKSWVYFTAIDTRRHYSSIYTGWELNPNESGAWDFAWTVHVVDNYGVSDKHWGNPLASEHFWAGTNAFTSSGPGWAYAQVSAGFVWLWDGSICYSYGPTDQAKL